MIRKVITHHEYPPIPDRQFDWCAYFDGEEELGHYGWGRTKLEAIRDLLENYDTSAALDIVERDFK